MKTLMLIILALLLSLASCSTTGELPLPASSSSAATTSPAVENTSENLSSSPTEFNWLDYDYTITLPPPVQYPAGACAVFASISVFESSIALQTGELVDLSEQHFLDYVDEWSDEAGVSPSDVLLFLENNGVATEETIPYTGKKERTLKMDGEYKLKSWGYEMLEGFPVKKRIEVIKDALLEYGPIMTNLAVYNDFGNYEGGIYECDESSGVVSGHWMTLLGWKDDSSVSSGGYWICKNSWGTGWGEDGYCRIAYGDKSGIDDYIIYYVEGLADSIEDDAMSVEPIETPEYLNLADQGIILPPQNQGEQKTDALFAVTGLLESALAKETGTIYDLSEQFFIDNFEYWSDGTSAFPIGVWPEMILDFYHENGTVLDSKSPYIGSRNENPSEKEGEFFIESWDVKYLGQIPSDDRISIIKETISGNGPVATNIMLFSSLKEYEGGIYQSDGSGSFISIHYLTIVGWKDDSEIESGGYWICKSSWGTDWGEGGYCNIMYNDSCGIDRYEIYFINSAKASAP